MKHYKPRHSSWSSFVASRRDWSVINLRTKIVNFVRPGHPSATWLYLDFHDAIFSLFQKRAEMELRGANISSRSYMAVMCCQKQRITREICLIGTIPLRTEHGPESLSTVCVYVWLGSLLGVFRRFSQRPTCYLYDEYWSDLWSHAGRWLAGLQLFGLR